MTKKYNVKVVPTSGADTKREVSLPEGATYMTLGDVLKEAGVDKLKDFMVSLNAGPPQEVKNILNLLVTPEDTINLTEKVKGS